MPVTFPEIPPIHQAAARFYRAYKENADVANADQIVLELVKSGADLMQLDTRGSTASQLTFEFRELFERLVASQGTVKK